MSSVRFAAVVALAGLAGCAVMTADSERLRLASPEFRDYVERVFREQNRVADQVGFALEGEGGPAGLAAVEQALLTACAGLNELATARRDSRDMGVGRRARLARGVPECERATRAAAAALAAAGD